MAQFSALKPPVFSVAEGPTCCAAAPATQLALPPQPAYAGRCLGTVAVQPGLARCAVAGRPQPGRQGAARGGPPPSKRHGLKAKAERGFVLSGDRASAEQGNPRLLTAEPGHDAVLVLDTDGEFARTPAPRHRPARPRWAAAGGAAGPGTRSGTTATVPPAQPPLYRGRPAPHDRPPRHGGLYVKSIVTVLEDQPKATLPQGQLAALRSGRSRWTASRAARSASAPGTASCASPFFWPHGDGVAVQTPSKGPCTRATLDTGTDERESTCKAR